MRRPKGRSARTGRALEGKVRMGRSRDSSLLFSLRELESLEQERIARERAERAARQQAQEQARIERERLAREAEAERLAAEEAARQREDQARREEAARLEALHHAAVARARAEVEARSLAELREARDAHEIEIARVHALDERRRLRWLFGLSLAATVTVGALAAALSVRLRDMEGLLGQRAAVALREREARESAQAALDAARREIDGLDRQLRTARSGPLAEPSDVTAPVRPSHGAPPRHTGTAPPRRGRLPPCTGDGDPLNGCLPANR